MCAGNSGGGRGGKGGWGWWGGRAALPALIEHSERLQRSHDANLPLKYTKLIGVEGHAHKQTQLIKCAPRKGKYCQFSGFKWGAGGVGPCVHAGRLS